MKKPAWRRTTIFGALVFAAHAPAVHAAGDDSFYSGKQITLIVGSGPGGYYDAYGRVLAQFLGEHIAGKPRVIVSNMAGAAGMRAASYIGNSAARDGTVIAITLSSVPTAPQLTPDGANFDPTKFSWIGSMTKDFFAGYVWHTSPIKTVADTLQTEATMGASTFGSAGADMAVIAKTFFGMKLKLVLGYPDSDFVRLAMEKGEVEGTFANGDIRSTRPEWLRDGLVRTIVQDGKKRAKDLPDVPSLYEFVKTDEQRISLDLLLARQDFSVPVFGPPGVQPARLEMLRRAFDETLKDPTFLEVAAGAKISIDEPMSGEELSAAVIELAKTPPEVSAHVREVFANYK